MFLYKKTNETIKFDTINGRFLDIFWDNLGMSKKSNKNNLVNKLLRVIGSYVSS